MTLQWRQGIVLAFALALLAPVAWAQNSRETERRLERVRKELRDVAAERRRIEGERGDAARELRQSDEQVAVSARALGKTESDLRQQGEALSKLDAERLALQQKLSAQRGELQALLRSSYAVGEAAPLKLMLSQDQVGEAGRALAYHRYLQRQRSQRIEVLREELAGLARIEREVGERQAALQQARDRQQVQVASLERDRRQRAQTVAKLEKRYDERGAREMALGRDAQSLEQLLKKLRTAAAKAEEARRTAPPASGTRTPAKPRTQVARAAPIQVGGLGWPSTGTLLAGYHGRMPDGRSSNGVLIGAASGAPVLAVADGTVVFAEWMTGYGLILIIDHGNGYMSLYAHNDALLKDAGDSVKRGDRVASVGTSGGHGQPALYFELRRNGQPVDPGSWLQKR